MVSGSGWRKIRNGGATCSRRRVPSAAWLSARLGRDILPTCVGRFRAAA
jgi:hypothetical protein